MPKDTWKAAEEQHLGCTTPKAGKEKKKSTMQKDLTEVSLVSVVPFHEHTHTRICMHV